MSTTMGRGVAERRHPDPDDELATAAGPCDDATVIVPPPSEVAPDLAWAADDDDEDDESVSGGAPSVPAETLAVPWGLVWGIAAAVMVVTILTASAIWLVGVYANSRIPSVQGNPVATADPAPTTMPATALPPISSEPLAPPTQAPVAAPPPPTVTVTATPQAAPPPPAPAQPPAAAADPDTVFRNFVRGIPGITVINWDVAEAGAHRVCGYLQAGHSRAEALQQVADNDPTFTAWQASAVVNASITAYCPQYGG